MVDKIYYTVISAGRNFYKTVKKFNKMIIDVKGNDYIEDEERLFEPARDSSRFYTLLDDYEERLSRTVVLSARPATTASELRGVDEFDRWRKRYVNDYGYDFEEVFIGCNNLGRM